MSTEALIHELTERAGTDPDDSVIEILHELLDDSTIEASAEPLSVAAAAELVGLSPHTLRYYESQGLVNPARDASGYREYAAADLRRLVFLTRMRVSGMRMRELTRYIALVDAGAATVPERRRIMLDQRDRIQRQIRELTLALRATEYKIRVYTPETPQAGVPDQGAAGGEAQVAPDARA